VQIWVASVPFMLINWGRADVRDLRALRQAADIIDPPGR